MSIRKIWVSFGWKSSLLPCVNTPHPKDIPKLLADSFWRFSSEKLEGSKAGLFFQSSIEEKRLRNDLSLSKGGNTTSDLYIVPQPEIVKVYRIKLLS